MTRAAVYRHVNAAGETLYIGCSVNPFMRFGVHLSQSEWAFDVTDIRIEWHATKDAALAAEAEAIRRESPPGNRQYCRAKMPTPWAANQGHVHLSRYLATRGEIDAFTARTGFSRKEANRLATEVRHIRISKQSLIALATEGFVPTNAWCRPSVRWPPMISYQTPEKAREEVLSVARLYRRWGTLGRVKHLIAPDILDELQEAS